eukprot:Hpha_TRINITY_DN15442_c3_g1::TRINITY_DN15442_c3_g1_i2::g.173034::m.173034
MENGEDCDAQEVELMLQRDVSHWKRNDDIKGLTNTDWSQSDRRLDYCMMWWVPYFVAILPLAFQFWQAAKPPGEVGVSECNVTAIQNQTRLDVVSNLWGTLWKEGSSIPTSVCVACNNGSTTIYIGATQLRQNGNDTHDKVARYTFYALLVVIFVLISGTLRNFVKRVYLRYRLLEYGICTEEPPLTKLLGCHMGCVNIGLAALLLFLLALLIAKEKTAPYSVDLVCPDVGATVQAITKASSAYDCTGTSCWTTVAVLESNLTYFLLLYPIIVTMLFLFVWPYDKISFGHFVNNPQLLRSLPTTLKYKRDSFDPRDKFFTGMLKREYYEHTVWYQKWKRTKKYFEDDVCVFLPFYCEYLLDNGLLKDLYETN